MKPEGIQMSKFKGLESRDKSHRPTNKNPFLRTCKGRHINYIKAFFVNKSHGSANKNPFLES